LFYTDQQYYGTGDVIYVTEKVNFVNYKTVVIGFPDGPSIFKNL